jgi:mRNA interferase RelE/StbE
VSAATQIYYAAFDAAFFKLPAGQRARVEAALDDMGRRLATFAHHRLKGSNRFRLRVGDYRVIYTFDLDSNKIHLLAIGHRREIDRS